MDDDRLRALYSTAIGPQHKSFPAALWGTTLRDWLATGPRLSALSTPVPTLDAIRVDENQDIVSEWARSLGVLLAPHGKTTMAPQLWRRQLDAGAWGITVATPWQAQVAVRFGVRSIMLANEFVDPVGLRWIRDEVDRDPFLRFVCWADDPSTVAWMSRVLGDGPGVPIDVLVEIGASGGRAGARTREAAVATARAVRAAPRLRLAGVAGWEGVLAHDRSHASVTRVATFGAMLTDLHRHLDALDLYEAPPIVTAGGSALPDVIAGALSPLVDDGVDVILRSGCYLTHDDGLYEAVSPWRSGVTDHPLRAALHVRSRVLSRPEPGLALLDAGRRDVSFDAGLPVPERLVTGGRPVAEIVAVNDQHSFCAVDPEDRSIVPGEVVRLGVSHPCTTFDKWTIVPVVPDTDDEDPPVIDVVHTFF